MSEETHLTSKIGKELLDPVFDLSIDYAEMAIDSLIDNDTLRDIPFFGPLVGIVKTGISVNKYFTAKKLLVFIQELNSGTIENNKLEEFRIKFNSEKKYRTQIVEQVMIFNERFISVEKSKISSNLFKAYIEKKIDWEEWVSLNINLDALHPSSIRYISNWSKIDFEIPKTSLKSAVEFKDDPEAEARLIASGLAKVGSAFENHTKLLESGKSLYEYGIKPIQSKEK